MKKFCKIAGWIILPVILMYLIYWWDYCNRAVEEVTILEVETVEELAAWLPFPSFTVKTMQGDFRADPSAFREGGQKRREMYQKALALKGQKARFYYIENTFWLSSPKELYRIEAVE